MSAAGASSVELPAGTVTFLFTDIEGSTAAGTEMGDEKYAVTLADHRERVAEAIDAHHGVIFGTEGDAIFAAFARASDALAAALGAQRNLVGHVLKVRIGLHTGEVLVSDGDYVGLTVHQVARVCSAGHGGQVVVSAATRELASRDLPDGVTLRDLGPHRLKDLAEPQHLFQLCHDDLRAEFPALRTLAGRPHNLPLQLNSFVGRDEALEEVERLVADHRLVTLTGVGGCGKTRLALHAAAELLDRFPDGVWLVDLAPVESPDLVAQAAASALDVAEGARSTIDAVIDHLSSRQMLLVVDNCEHLAVGVADLVEVVLQKCPSVHVLATSREYLGVTGEVTLQVPSLSVSEGTEVPPSDEVIRYGAVRLFMERALSADPGFALRPGDADIVMRICRRLDGIPLAIELAAPKIRTFDLKEIERRLDDRFRLLSGGTRRGLGRQQTLRATVDWSHDLLGEEERVLLRRLSVFSGGFTLDAAERVCGDELLDADAIVDVLEHLVTRSLVAMERGNTGTRYRQLETIRQYGFEKLADAAEVDAMRARHLAWCVEFACRAEPELERSEQIEWLDLIDADAANLRAALDWAAEHDPGTGLALATRLRRWWLTRGGLSDGRARLAALIAAAPSQSDAHRRLIGEAQLTAAVCAAYQNDLIAARPLYVAAIEAARTADDLLTLGMALSGLGFVIGMHGDHAESLRLLEEARATLQAFDPLTPTLAGAYANTATITSATGDLSGACEWYERAVDHSERVGHLAGVAFSSGQLANLLYALHDRDGAAARRAQALAMARRLRDWRTLGGSLRLEFEQAMERGDFVAAREFLTEFETLVPHLGGVMGVLLQAARVLVEFGDGDAATACRLAGATVTAAREFPNPEWRGYVLETLALPLAQHGELGLARECALEGIKAAREGPDPLAWTSPKLDLGIVEAFAGHHDEARRVFEEATTALADGGAPPLSRAVAHFMAVIAIDVGGDSDTARRHFEAAASLGVSNPVSEQFLGISAGVVAMNDNDLVGARARFEAALDHAQRWGRANILARLAQVAVREGNAAAAAEACRNAIEDAHRARFPVPLLMAIEAAVPLLVAAGEHDRVARVVGATRALHASIGSPVFPRFVTPLDDAVARARAALGDDATNTAIEAGRGLDTGAMVALVLEGLARG